MSTYTAFKIPFPNFFSSSLFYRGARVNSLDTFVSPAQPAPSSPSIVERKKLSSPGFAYSNNMTVKCQFHLSLLRTGGIY